MDRPVLYRVESAEHVVRVMLGPLSVMEVCEVCYRQGVIAAVHPAAQAHAGSPHFKPYQPTPESLRRTADRMEQELKRTGETE